MKLKNFNDLIKERFSEEEIAAIEQQAELEAQVLRLLQEEIRRAVDYYMKVNKIGFNEMVRRLNSNATQLTKIQKGQANLTLASLAHLSALLGKSLFFQFCKKNNQ